MAPAVMKDKIWPSVMPKNQEELVVLLKKLRGVSKELHLDVTDGKFVPTNYFNFPFKLRKGFSYNAHLMIKDPETWIEKHKREVNLIIPHWEAIEDKNKFISWMKKEKKPIAFALRPETGIDQLRGYLEIIDYLLILTVHPGYYGAPFLPEQLKKISKIKKLNSKIKIIVDGGINLQTIKDAKKGGADYFVSGSFVSKSIDPKKSINELKVILSEK
ncbi:ribulose-phosphate 3-epimerase [Candidatus Woesearchaeota archaeon]|nr:ribulose-phosphate 3-epimerase [Candidatus Woesearchaeota archaeon]